MLCCGDDEGDDDDESAVPSRCPAPAVNGSTGRPPVGGQLAILKNNFASGEMAGGEDSLGR